MAIAVSGLLNNNAGSQNATSGTLTFSGTYTTGGVALSANAIGLDTINSISINQGEDGYVFKYDMSANKVLIYTSGGFTPAGTISGTAAAQVFTGDAHTHDLLIIGGQAAAGTDTVQGSTADSILGKEEAANATIAGADSATKGGVVATTSTGTNASSAITATFTGTAVAAGALAQLANGASLTGIVTQFSALGY